MIYIIILILIIFCVVHFDLLKMKNGYSIFYYFIFFILIATTALRYKVGGDTQNYYKYFETFPKYEDIDLDFILNSYWNPLWVLLNSLVKSISDDFYVLQLIHSLIINLVLIKLINKYCKFKFIAILIYYIVFYLYFNMEILRESISISIFIISIQYLKDNKFLKYYFCVIIAILFHTSATILILLPFIKLLKFNKWGILISSLITLTIFIFQHNIASILIEGRNNQKYDTYSSIVSNYNGIIFNSIYYIIFPGIILKYYLVKNKIHLFNYLYLSYFMVALIVIFIPGFSRFINYFTPFMLVIFVKTLENITTDKFFKELSFITIFILLVMIFIPKVLYYKADTSKYYPNTIKFNLWYPYSSIFNEEDYPYRDIIFNGSMDDTTNNR